MHKMQRGRKPPQENKKEGKDMTDNKLLSSRSQRYEVRANNGQVLEHGFTSQKKALDCMKKYKKLHPNDSFYISGYDNGKYGNE